jgi:hypothetical protein
MPAPRRATSAFFSAEVFVVSCARSAPAAIAANATDVTTDKVRFI